MRFHKPKKKRTDLLFSRKIVIQPSLPHPQSACIAQEVLSFCLVANMGSSWYVRLHLFDIFNHSGGWCKKEVFFNSGECWRCDGCGPRLVFFCIFWTQRGPHQLGRTGPKPIFSGPRWVSEARTGAGKEKWCLARPTPRPRGAQSPQPNESPPNMQLIRTRLPNHQAPSRCVCMQSHCIHTQG